MSDKNYSLDDVFHMVVVYLVCVTVVCLVGIYGFNFLMTIWLYKLPLWFTLKCYLMLLAGEICVSLIIVGLTAIIDTLILQESTRSLRMLFPLYVTLLPLCLNLWIYHLRVEGFYISFSYEYRYAIIGIIIILLFLLFGKIGPLKGLLYYAENDNTQDSL